MEQALTPADEMRLDTWAVRGSALGGWGGATPTPSAASGSHTWRGDYYHYAAAAGDVRVA